MSRATLDSPSCHSVLRTRLSLFGRPSQTVLLTYDAHFGVLNPNNINIIGLALPRSLAATYGISVDFSSSPYLDVSVQAVPRIHLCVQCMLRTYYRTRVSPFGNLRVDGYLLLSAAYRSLSRPSSAPGAKAFPLRPF